MSLSPHYYAKKLIGIAESNLEAAEVLLNGNVYPQALFLTQQALEKVIKAVALELNLITPEDAGYYGICSCITMYSTNLSSLMQDILRMDVALQSSRREHASLRCRSCCSSRAVHSKKYSNTSGSS